MDNHPQKQGSSVFLEPDRLVKSFEISLGDHIADFGAGHGYFTVPMARIVGSDGKIYAIDVQKQTLEMIRTKAKMEHLLNIEPIWANLEEPQGSKLKNNFLDFVNVANILFQAEEKMIIIAEAYRILRDGGRLSIVEWDTTPTPLGPPLTLRIPKEDAKNMASRAGFIFQKELGAGEHHYGLLFVK